MAKFSDKQKKKMDQKGDLLDDVKYKLRGAYHFKKFITNKRYENYVRDVTNFLGKEHKGEVKPTLLDVGCGDGLLTYLLRLQGFNVSGIDANETAINIAKVIGSGDDLDHKDFFEYIGRRFRVVCMFDVFEHLTDTKNIINKLNQLAEYRIYIVLPTGRSAESDHHVTTYSQEKVERMFDTYPWKLVKTKVYPEVEKLLLVFQHT